MAHDGSGVVPFFDRYDRFLESSKTGPDLERLNALAPWSAFTLDAHGRRVGCAHSGKKRATPQAIPDPRIVELDRRYGLRGRSVLEIGCFEGIHTVASQGFVDDFPEVAAWLEDFRMDNELLYSLEDAMFGEYDGDDYAPVVDEWIAGNREWADALTG